MKVAVLLPAHGAAFRRHEQCLRELTRAEPSWTCLQLPQASNIEFCRTALAAEAERRGAECVLWIDADVTFAVESARSIVGQAFQRQAVVGGPYLQQKFGGAPRVDFLDAMPVTFGPDGATTPVRALGFGFVAHPVSVLSRMREHHRLPRLRMRKPVEWGWPWFASTAPGWEELMGEDYAFCRRAREAGIHVFCDTRIELGHLGEHEFVISDLRPLERPRTVILEPKEESK